MPVDITTFNCSVYGQLVPDRLLEYCTVTLAEDRKTIIMICIVCMRKRNANPKKVPFQGTHPDIFQATGTEKATLLAAAKDLVTNLTYDQIDTHIDNIFANLNSDQKNSLKKLYKMTLYLAKK